MNIAATVEKLLYKFGEYSENTHAMMCNIICDYYDWTVEDSLHIIVNAIEDVMNGLDTDMGEDFADRVNEALSYTPDPFAPY